MTEVLVITSFLLAAAWLPLAVKFRRGWQSRHNPVSLAICVAILCFAYTDVMFALAIADWTTWRFFAVSTHITSLVTVVNFYAAFRWSDTKYPDARRRRADGSYSIPPTNVTTRSPGT